MKYEQANAAYSRTVTSWQWELSYVTETKQHDSQYCVLCRERFSPRQFQYGFVHKLTCTFQPWRHHWPRLEWTTKGIRLQLLVWMPPESLSWQFDGSWILCIHYSPWPFWKRRNTRAQSSSLCMRDERNVKRMTDTAARKKRNNMMIAILDTVDE